ncbi:MAG: tetratricopeptide repeat protein [Candidatus Scalindua sp.]|nr:tetratricopeptide repeat protein [Candidatus Scalindua sp.]
MYTNIKRINLTLSILLPALLICLFAYAQDQDHQLADRHWHKAQDLEKRGKYNEAVKYLEEAMTIFKKLGQEDKIADCLSHLGGIYKSVGSYDRAIEYLEEALEIDKRLGMEDKAAIRLSNIGDVYDSQGQYDKAIEYLEDVLRINKKLGMEADAAIRLNSIGRVLETQGKYGRAIEYFEKALNIDRKLEQDDKISIGLANIGNIFKSGKQYDTAIKYYENALDIDKKLGQGDKVVLQLANIGGVYETQGKYVKAWKYYEEALDTAETVNQDNNIAIGLANIGNIFKYWGQHEVTIKYYEKALAINKKLGHEDKVAIRLNYIGGVYKSTGQYDDALKYYKEALEINRKLGKEADEALSLKNLDMVYRYYWSKHDKAIKPHEQKLATDKKFGKDADISGDLNNIGMVYLLQKEYKPAIGSFNESVSIIEKLRKATTGEVRRGYLADQSYTYQLLASAYIRDNDISSAFRTIELSRAKLMAERFAGDKKKIRLQEVEQIRETLGEDTAIIVYANVNREDIIQFAITGEEFTGREVSRKSFVQSSIDKYHTPIKALLINQHNLSENKNDFDNIINYYSSLLREPSPQDERERRADIDKLGKGLYELLIKPMEAQLADKKNLIIVPGGILTFVPFETLIDRNGQYLVENYHINYVQSVDIRKLIKKREHSDKRKPLLAFGGAVYEEAAYDAEVIENEAQMALFKKNIYSDLKNIRQELAEKKVFSDFVNIRYIRNAYNGLGIGTWPDLPDTLNEVKNINKVIKRSDIFTGSNVTEKDVKELSKNWTLYNYKVLHFATHGLVVNEVPELSAVVLSQFEKDEGKEDGYLRIEEIAELDFQADLITLSACETSLDRVDGNAGIMGFTQSFILAGANAVSISLWRAAGESTSQFMAAMYGMVQDKGIGYAEAITEVKRRFISGSFGEKYKAPYYWAPFVYYGN